MKKEDILELEIVSSGMNGEGVAREDGMVVFIPNALVGEKVRVQVTFVKKAFANARVIKVLEPSKDRVVPLCPIFFRCGGCEMQHINYPTQLKIKQSVVKNCIDKECKIDANVAPTVACSQQFGYRNKIQVPFMLIDDKTVCGYYKQNSHTLVPFSDKCIGEFGACPLHCKTMQTILDCFCEFSDKAGLTIYDETTGRGLVRHLVIRKIGDSYAIVVVINGKILPFQSEFIKLLHANLDKFSLYLSINTDQTNVIMGEELTTLCGDNKIKGNKLGINFAVSPLSFMQVNDEICDKIYAEIKAIVASQEGSIVFDAYSGIGILSNIVSRSARKVYGLEIVESAVKDADAVAKLNHNDTKIRNILGDIVLTLPRLIAELKDDPEYVSAKKIVIIDPPRKGCEPAVIETILSVKADIIAYISCNPATLARDMKLLLEDYEIASLTPYDMFPQTGSVETLAYLTRKVK